MHLSQPFLPDVAPLRQAAGMVQPSLERRDVLVELSTDLQNRSGSAVLLGPMTSKLDMQTSCILGSLRAGPPVASQP